MRSIDLKSLGVSLDEVRTLQTCERRPGVSRRLIAIASILAGGSIKQAAYAAKSTRGTVERWLNQVQRSGIRSLLLDRRRRYPKREMSPTQVEETRRHIAAALARPLKPQVRSRLVAIDTVLSGQGIEEAAVSARVTPNTVKGWLRLATYNGIEATLERWQVDRRLRPGKLDVDPATLHELAAKEINPRVRKRIRALACIAEGMSTYDAEAKVLLGHGYITKRVRRFQEEGVAGFQDRPPFGRPAKLTYGQLQELRSQVLAHPEMSYTQLRDLVEARFCVRYSVQGLRRLLKKRLAIVSGRKHSAPTRPPS